MFQAQLADRLPCLLLIATVYSDRSTSWDIRFAFSSGFWLRVGRARGVLGSGLLRGLVVRELFYPRIGHLVGGANRDAREGSSQPSPATIGC